MPTTDVGTGPTVVDSCRTTDAFGLAFRGMPHAVTNRTSQTNLKEVTNMSLLCQHGRIDYKFTNSHVA